MFDKGRERGWNRWKIMVLEVLVFGRLVWDESGGSEEEVGGRRIEGLV